MTAERPRVAVVGLGKMGAPIADRVLEAGFPLSVWNRSPERAEPFRARGAEVLDTPAQALAQADVCVSMLADDASLDGIVVGGVLAGARPDTMLIDMTTVSVAVSERVAAAAEGAGVAYLRAPVSGNPGVVASGMLTILVSGAGDAFEANRGLLEAIGRNVLYVGEGERARVAKLVLQIVGAGTAELLAEALVFGEAAGLEPAKVLEVVNASVVGSRFTAYKSEPLLRDDYSATFTTAMMLKDVDLVLDRARASGVGLPFAEQLRVLLEQAVEGGHAHEDFMALYLELRARAQARAGAR